MSVTDLPKGYSLVRKIDLKDSKRESLLVNGISLVLLILMVLPGNLYAPFSIVFFKITKNEHGELLFMFLAILALILYIFAHEAIHGVFMKKYSGIKVKYGFTGLFAYAGSTAFFGKKHYIIIALSPIIILGLVLILLNVVVPKEWFWFIYILQITNISGAAGDLYVTYIMSKMPEDILTQDLGISMTMYSKTK